MLYRIVCAGLLLLCTGCYNKARSHGQAAVRGQGTSFVVPDINNILPELEKTDCAYKIFVDEAQLADIPIPDILLSWHKETLVDSRRHILKYTCNLSIQDCAAFYRVHMEYVGWQDKELFTGNQEQCLLFKKPSRIAIITVSSSNSTNKVPVTPVTQVTIFTGPRKKTKGA